MGYQSIKWSWWIDIECLRMQSTMLNWCRCWSRISQRNPETPDTLYVPQDLIRPGNPVRSHIYTFGFLFVSIRPALTRSSSPVPHRNNALHFVTLIRLCEAIWARACCHYITPRLLYQLDLCLVQPSATSITHYTINNNALPVSQSIYQALVKRPNVLGNYRFGEGIFNSLLRLSCVLSCLLSFSCRDAINTAERKALGSASEARD